MLLRVRQTKTNLHRWTVQFCLKYLQLHDADGVVPHDNPYKTFFHAWDVTLFLDMQKNCVWGESTTMVATDLAQGDPVSDAAWRFLHLCSHQANPDTTICYYFITKGGLPKRITSTHIVLILRLHAAKIGFQRLGLYPHKIVPHSLCSGGTMTPHHAHIPNSTIKIISRWHLDAFLI